MRRGQELAIVAVILLSTILLRLIHLDQPIVENYVGRQVPTAMVASFLRNGGAFLRPQLNTGPWPNLFLVEPPVYAWIVAQLSGRTGLALEPSGRLVSAIGVALGAWGLYGLTRRREGIAVALISLLAFGLAPVTIRYGRAFQPDALMLGLLLAGLRCWDAGTHDEGLGWFVFGGFFLSLGLALKIISAYILIPLLFIRPFQLRKALVLLALLLPAIAWYLWAGWLLRVAGAGSRASADNAGIWLSVLWPRVLIDPGFWGGLARTVSRALTPIGIAMAVAGWRRSDDPVARFWKLWAVGLGTTFLILAAKTHHEYYWLALAPLTAVGVGRLVVGLWNEDRRALAAGLAAGLVVMSVALSMTTFRTPDEWQGLGALAQHLRAKVPSDTPIVAVEALLQATGHRGYRLEFAPDSQRRAAGEWGGTLNAGANDPLELVRFYQSQGARIVAGLESSEPRHITLREAIRRGPILRFEQVEGAGWVATLQ